MSVASQAISPSKKELKKVRKEARRHMTSHAMVAATDLENMIIRLSWKARLSVAWKIFKGRKFLTDKLNADAD